MMTKHQSISDNKKGQAFEFFIFLFVIAIIIGILVLIFAGISYFFLNKGTSVDYPYSVEHSSIGWDKLWLKDDHTTVYCFDNPSFKDVIEKARSENKKVKVYYQDYVFRGSLCLSGNDEIGTTVITDIEIYEGGE